MLASGWRGEATVTQGVRQCRCQIRFAFLVQGFSGLSPVASDFPVLGVQGHYITRVGRLGIPQPQQRRFLELPLDARHMGEARQWPLLHGQFSVMLG